MHPRQLDVNFAATANDRDWLHTNSIAYNEELDQVVVQRKRKKGSPGWLDEDIDLGDL